jgi:hypothetical protein
MYEVDLRKGTYFERGLICSQRFIVNLSVPGLRGEAERVCLMADISLSASYLIKSPSKASRLKPVPLAVRAVVIGTGFSRLKPVPLSVPAVVSGTGFSRLKPVPLTVRAAVSGTGFSREEAGLGTINFAV